MMSHTDIFILPSSRTIYFVWEAGQTSVHGVQSFDKHLMGKRKDFALKPLASLFGEQYNIIAGHLESHAFAKSHDVTTFGTQQPYIRHCRRFTHESIPIVNRCIIEQTNNDIHFDGTRINTYRVASSGFRFQIAPVDNYGSPRTSIYDVTYQIDLSIDLTKVDVNIVGEHMTVSEMERQYVRQKQLEVQQQQLAEDFKYKNSDVVKVKVQKPVKIYLSKIKE